jgi:surface protein
MDVVTMVLIEQKTVLPLDLVVFINSFLPEVITNRNFKEAVDLWFKDEEKCKWRFGHISDWNTSRVTNMGWAFFCQRNFNEDISRWDVSSVTDMSGMFVGCGFNGDLSCWDVSNVTNMSVMFYEANQFNGDLSRWNVSKVTDMSSMFLQASEFNGDLSQWDVKNVTDMSHMFRGAHQFNKDHYPIKILTQSDPKKEIPATPILGLTFGTSLLVLALWAGQSWNEIYEA